jgi:hypothetical protein
LYFDLATPQATGYTGLLSVSDTLIKNMALQLKQSSD